MGSGLQLLTAPPPGAEANCYVESPLGIAALMRSVAAVGPRAAAYLEDGQTFIHSSVLAVDDASGTLLLDKSRDPELNKLVLSAAHVTVVTSDHGVPVQFICLTPRLAQHHGIEVFAAKLPDRVLRLQRRDAYRLPGDPLLERVTCHVYRSDKAQAKILSADVLDVSCSGISIAVSNNETKLERESRHKCRIELPAFVRFDTGMLVHGSRDIALPDGTAGQAYGVEFLNLDPTAEVLLQRFITEEQRRAKKARS